MIAVLKYTLDRKLVKYLLLFFLVSILLSTVSVIIAKWEGIAFASFGWKELFINLIVRYVSKFVFIFFAIVLVRFLFLKKIITGWMRIFLHFVFAILLAFYSIFFQVLASKWFMGDTDDFSWDYIYSRAILGTDYNFFLYFCMIAIVYAYYFFKKQKDYEVKESNLKTQLLDSKINALQSQLQPHFLFNALNDISSLIDISHEKSQDAIADLSELLRQTLAIKNTKFIPIVDEITLLKKYLDIEKIRFQDKLNFTILASEELLKRSMPPLLLQPIVENSVKHGFSYQHDAIDIGLEITAEENYTVFKISNNGKPINEEELTYGTGISNVLSRLDTLYEGDFTFEMMNTKEQVTTILKIPDTKIE